MKAFNLSFATVLMRFYLMMGIIIGSLFIGQPLLAFLALPVFLSAILGVEINTSGLFKFRNRSRKVQKPATKIRVATA